MKWLSDLKEEERSTIIDLAVKQRRLVTKDEESKKIARAQQRKEKMLLENTRRLARERKLCDEKEKLMEAHLITSTNELMEELNTVDQESLSSAKKRNKKLEILKTQVQIRKKVLNQNVPVVFTTERKQRSLCDIVKDLCSHMDKNPLPDHCKTYVKDPTSLLGRKVKQRFINEEGSTWYKGTVKGYSCQDKMHSIEYEGETEIYYFDLTIDLIIGDLVVL